MSIISNLALGQLRSHRKRSMVIAAAILLTTLLFMTVLSITVGIAQSVELMKQLATGSDAHANFDAEQFMLPPYELMERVKAEAGVDDAFLIASYQNYTDDVSENNRRVSTLFAVSGENVLEHLFMTLEEGSFPADADEILLNRELYPDMKIGDTITITSQLPLKDKPVFMDFVHTYTVSGFTSGATDEQFPALVWYSPEVVADYDVDLNVFLTFDSTIDITGKLNRLLESLSDIHKPDVEVSSRVNNAFIGADIVEFLTNPANILLILCSVAVVFFAAFLLIYNIYSIALTQDMQTYGLLGVIGTTYRQMKQLILRQTLILYAAALPVGLTAGYFIGWRLLMPIFMRMADYGDLPYRFSGWLLILTALLTLVTLIFSALRPLRRIRKLTPIQAVNATADTVTKRERQRGTRRRAAPFTLAMAAVRRNPKKLIVTSLSAALSILLFVFIGAVADGVTEVTLSDMQAADFILSYYRDTDYGSAPVSLYNDVPMDESIPQQIAAIDGIVSVDCVRYAYIQFKGTQSIADYANAYMERRGADSPWISQKLKDAAAGNPHAVVISIPDEYCKYLRVSRDANGKYYEYGSAKELYDGQHILSVAEHFKSFGETSISAHLEGGELLVSGGLSQTYTAIEVDSYIYSLFRKICNISWSSSDLACFVLPSSVFDAEFADSSLFAILAEAENGREEEVRAALDELAGRTPTVDLPSSLDNASAYLHISGKLEQMETLRERLAAINIVGYSLSAIIFLIGLINIVNSSLTSVMLRRREYAMLEAVGMTGRQLRAMMLWENSVFSAAAALALVIGIPLADIILANGMGVEVTLRPVAAVVMLLVLIAASAATSLAVWSMLAKSPVTERIRAAE
ncbi:MAG: ABC transporter permease [Clostridia bacterium]|nr:ABC transporter permease [Clostridia bacterium]